MRPLQLLGSAIAVGLIIFVAMIHRSSNDEVEKPTKGRQLTQGEPRALMVGAPPASLPASTTGMGAAPAPLASLGGKRFSDFEGATDLRVFVERMKRSDEQGAGLYVSTAILECVALRTGVLATEQAKALRHQIAQGGSAHAMQRRADWDRIEGRCAGFSEAELNLDEWNFQHQAVKSRDPLLQLRAKLMASAERTPQAFGDMLAPLLASREPLLQREVPGLLQVIESVGGQVLLDGVAYGGLSRDEYWLAWQLAACTANGSCSTRDPSVLYRCAFEDQCFSSVLDSIRADAGDDAKYVSIERVASRLTDLIVQGDARPLLGR